MQGLSGCESGPGEWGAVCCKGQQPAKLTPRDPSTGDARYDMATNFMPDPNKVEQLLSSPNNPVNVPP
jgi:hypothetical protein